MLGHLKNTPIRKTIIFKVGQIKFIFHYRSWRYWTLADVWVYFHPHPDSQPAWYIYPYCVLFIESGLPLSDSGHILCFFFLSFVPSSCSVMSSYKHKAQKPSHICSPKWINQCAKSAGASLSALPEPRGAKLRLFRLR